MKARNSSLRIAMLGGGFLLAGAIGFLLARSTSQPQPPPAAQNAPVTAQSNELKIDPSYLAVVGIAMAPVESGNLSVEVLAPATVAASPNGIAVVTAHAAGTIVRVGKQLGAPVSAGEVLALVESREAATMVADLKVAQSKAALARSALMREQELYNQRVTPRQDLERAQSELAVAEAEVQRAVDAVSASHVTQDGRIAVTAPLSGRLTAIAAPLGTFVQPETELFRITDPRFVQIEASVPASEVNRLAVGDAARIVTASGTRFAATVRSITPSVNEQTRATTVVLAPEAAHENLSPGESLQVAITPKNSPLTGVIVPEDAIQNVGGRTIVFVRTATGFRVQPVAVGPRAGGRVSITSGLSPGETIATTNAFFLKAELNKGTGEDE